MNKTKKVLSIILITLLILSTIFTLCKKVGLCASSDSIEVNGFYPIEFPLPINSELFGCPIPITSEGLDAIRSCSNVNENVISYWDSGQDYVEVSCFNVTSFNLTANTSDPLFFQFTYTVTGTDIVRIYPSTNSCSITAHYGSGTTSVCHPSYMFSQLSNNNYYIPYQSYTVHYPLWVSSGQLSANNTVYFTNYSGGSDSPGFNHYFWQNYQDSIDDVDNNNSIWKPNYQNPTNQQGFWDNVTDFFNRSFKSLLGGISGATKTIGDYIEQFYNGTTDFWGRCIDTILGWLSGLKDDTDDISDDTSDISGTVSSIDSRLSTFFNNFWDNFDDHFEDFIEGIWNDLPDIMKAPYRIAMWFYQHGLKNGEFDFLTLWEYLFDFDSQTAYNLWSSNKYGDFILDVRDFFSDLISSITGVTASDRVFFTISLGNHFGVAIPDIEIDFSWYASIRDQFLPYLMAFLYVSVLWLFFKRLPDILKGVAGAESSFADNLPHEFSNVSTDVNNRTVTFTHGSRSRSGTTSTSTRLKY